MTLPAMPRLAELGGATLEDGSEYPVYEPREVDLAHLSFVYRMKSHYSGGHYWRGGRPHLRRLDHVHRVCRLPTPPEGGTMVAYRWNGEPESSGTTTFHMIRKSSRRRPQIGRSDSEATMEA